MTVEIPIIAFVASVVAMFFLNIAMLSISRDYSKLQKRVFELETLVDYIYELRHIPISEAHLNKSAKEVVDYVNSLIDREDG